MAFVSITDAQIAAGSPADQPLFQKIKDNQDALYSQIGSLPNLLPNGSFEIDSDGDGVPNGGTRGEYPGGSVTMDTDSPLHGATSLKIESPGGSGNGGGYWEFDYVEVSEVVDLTIAALMESSVAGVHNLIEAYWFDKDKVALTGDDESSAMYDSESNTTDAVEISGYLTPPSGARYAKVRLTGAKSDNATAGIVRWDNVRIGYRKIDTVTAEESGSTEYLPDRIYVDDVLSSPVATNYGTTRPTMAVKGGVTGGRDVEVTFRTSTSTILTATLTLPHGVWLIIAFGVTVVASATQELNLNAVAIRQA